MKEKNLIFATGNANKVLEIKAMLDDSWTIRSLKDIGCNEEIPETQDTIEGNARQKANYIFDKYGLECFAEDTGLEVKSLDGAPGVHSARFSGPERDANQNMDLLLSKLKDKDDRSARFKTVIAFRKNDKVICFEGIVEGQITFSKKGSGGFGYDPIFQPDGFSKTFGELDAQIKNTISHRARAMKEFLAFLDPSMTS